MRLKSMFALLFAVSTAAWATPGKDDLQARRDALNALLAEQWEYRLSRSPESASMRGDKRWNDQISDSSQASVDARLARNREFLKRFEAIDTTGFPEQEALNQRLMVRGLREDIEGSKWKSHLMPADHMSGFHLILAQIPSLLTYKTVQDYEDLIARYRKYPKEFDNTIENMRAGMAAGLMPPKFLMEKVAAQAAEMAATSAEQSPFARPLAKMPAEIPEAEQKRIRERTLAAIQESLLPAYARYAKFMKEEYAPRGRTEPGLWALPDGAGRYAWMVEQSTTARTTPEEIHQIGLREVARIETEMLAIARKQGFKDVKSFNASIESDPKHKAKSREHILELYRQYIDQMYTRLPELFSRLPKAKVEVVKVEEFREKTATGAQYLAGAPDGSRPGRVMVNTGEPESRKIITIESTAYHEGVPGHHMQLSIAQELPELPPFRQRATYTSYNEGWALYAERLGKEVGFYQDPYSDYGRLQDEMMRAIRLVVDTGLHSKRWSRDQVVQYFRDHTAMDEVDIQSETDRYIAWPGQALAYKVGQMKILELRERARKELGAKFDLRKFHDAVLGGGALPLDVLEERIDQWIAAQQRG